MARPKPLYLRLYTEPHLMALVRLVGYEGAPVAEVKERLKPLVEQYGKDRMQTAAREVIRIDASCEPPVARLTNEARKLAWQLLGPPPEQAAGLGEGVKERRREGETERRNGDLGHGFAARKA